MDSKLWFVLYCKSLYQWIKFFGKTRLSFWFALIKTLMLFIWVILRLFFALFLKIYLFFFDFIESDNHLRKFFYFLRLKLFWHSAGIWISLTVFLLFGFFCMFCFGLDLLKDFHEFQVWQFWFWNQLFRLWLFLSWKFEKNWCI